MNIFFRIIGLIIVFIVAYMLFMIVRWLFMPHLRVFPYTAQPQALIMPVWGLILFWCAFIFGWVLAFIVFCWVVYWIIKIVIPWPFKDMLLKVSPLREFEETGIFGLLDAMWSIIFSKMSASDRFVNLARAFSDYVKRSSGFLLNVIKGIPAPPPNDLRATRQKTAKNQTERRYEKPPVFDKEDNAYVDEEYQRCIEENTLPIYPSMSTMDRNTAVVQNRSNSIMCKMKALTNSLSILGFNKE